MRGVGGGRPRGSPLRNRHRVGAPLVGATLGCPSGDRGEDNPYWRLRAKADNATASSELSVDGGSSEDIFSTSPNREIFVKLKYVCGTVLHGDGHVRPFWEDIIMKSSLGFVVPAAIAILSTTLLSGTAASQTATDAATALPTITVEASKHLARPRQVARQRPAQGATVASRPTASQTPSGAPGSVLARIAKLEKASSSCNGGCETSFKTGNAPWVGCSEAAGLFHTFSATCRDTLTYKSYEDCRETKSFLGLERNKVWWLCTSLAAGGKFQVADLKRAPRPR